METLYTEASDGLRLAYDCTGEGPAVLLLHGMPGGREQWHTLGYVERLRRERFAVVTLDARGFGESDAPEDIAAYTIDRMLADVHAVADACSLAEFAIWGFSFGATLALRLAATSTRVTRALIAGAALGPAVTPDDFARALEQIETVQRAKEDGRLDDLPLSPEQRAVLTRSNIRAHAACLRAMTVWPETFPGPLRCRTLIYAGDGDTDVAASLLTRRRELTEHGIELRLLAGLDHLGEITAVETVLPLALDFLRASRHMF